MARMYIQLTTDYTPEEDFSHVEVVAARRDRPRENHVWVHTADGDEDYADGETVAEFGGIRRRRDYQVVVRLLDRRGRSVDMRTIRVRPGSRRRLLVVDIAEE